MGVAVTLGADAGAGVPSVLTLLGIALYGGIAWATIHFAVRWAEAALSPRDDVPAADAARATPGAGRDGR